MKLNTALLKKVTSRYSIVPGTETRIDLSDKEGSFRYYSEDSIQYVEGGESYWIGNRRGTKFAPEGVYTVALFECREAFEFNGHSVAKGHQKYFAF